MGFGSGRRGRRSVAVAVASVAVVVTTGCTGRGGGQLPANATMGFSGAASFGFSFSCEDSGGTNPLPGRLRIQLSYSDHGRSATVDAPFAVHGTVDELDPVLESQICIGQEPPPGGNELIFLGRYRAKGTPPPGLPATCTSDGTTTAACRFEVIVRDNDGDGGPSAKDFFSIKLSSATAITSELDPATVAYTRAGLLASGNLTVD